MGSLRHRGFTLVEIMVVVVIIGLLAALAIPAFQRIQRASQNTRILNDFRVYAQAFETYNTEFGAWPASAGAGVLPVEMAGRIKSDTWQLTTEIGGNWNWDTDTSGITAGISITGFTCTDAQLAEIDARIDDGNLATGRFRKVQPSQVMLILQD
jgi:type IV pilus assembly protein PilA